MKENDYNTTMKVSYASIIINFILSAFKFIAGIIGKSSAMISDAVHSLSDVLSTIIVIIGIRFSNKKSDDTHQYGHERFESIATLFLSMILLVTALGIGYTGTSKIIDGINGNIKVPTLIALIASIISIIVKEWMYQITKKVAKKVNSSALLADAWHHRSDALSSIGSLIGIVGAQMGLPILDPIMSIIICLFILKVALEILIDSIYKLVDKACDEKTIEKMTILINNIDGVLKLDLLQTRLFGSKIYVDVEVSVDKNKTLEESHRIAHLIHDDIENNFINVKHCMVHVNPK
ncbi:MAG: cation transporter [Firmicutes bacterium]|nr:cation transporter [Bacillota bacterium]